MRSAVEAEMSLLLLAFITSTLGAFIEFRDVSDRFDQSLEKMLKELKHSGNETAYTGTFPSGNNTWLQDSKMGNFTTIRRTSQSSLMTVRGRISVTGGFSLGEMFIVGIAGRRNSNEAESQRTIVIRENMWGYNFWINQEFVDCNDGVVLILTDMGQMKLIYENGHRVQETDVTYLIKHQMDDLVRRRISGALAEVLKQHFDFCNLVKN